MISAPGALQMSGLSQTCVACVLGDATPLKNKVSMVSDQIMSCCRMLCYIISYSSVSAYSR